MCLLARFCAFAKKNAIVIRVVLLLFPPVSMTAPVLLLAALVVSLNEVLCLPVGTLVFAVGINVRLSPEVLPVVRINALLPIV